MLIAVRIVAREEMRYQVVDSSAGVALAYKKIPSSHGWRDWIPGRKRPALQYRPLHRVALACIP